MLAQKPLPDFGVLQSQFEAHLAAKPGAGILNFSRTQNLPTSKEEIASLASKVVDIVLSNTHKDAAGYQHLLENRKNLAVLASNALKCRYISVGNNPNDILTLIKQHHGFVIRLIAWKDLETALLELVSLRRALLGLLSLPENSENTTDTFPCMSLYECIHYVHNTPAASLVVAYYFLVLQTTLQYITIHVDLAANEALFEATAAMLSLSHSFRMWLDAVHAVKCDSRPKNLNNLKKMATGYAKTLQYVHSKTPSSKIQTYKSLFLLKMAEYDLLASGDTLVTFDGMKINPLNGPFITDLKEALSSVEVNSSTLRVEEALIAISAPLGELKSITLVLQKEVIQTIDNLVRSPTPASLETFTGTLLHSSASPGLINNNDFLSSVKSLCVHLLKEGEFAITIAQTLVTYFESSLKNVTGLSKEHLLILDPITIFIKNSLSDINSVSADYIEDTITKLFDLLSRGRLFKRIRNLSNLLYNLGSKSLPVNNWRLSLSYESFIYNYNTSTRTEDNLSFYKAKVEKIVNALYELNFFGESISLISQFLVDAFQQVECNIPSVLRQIKAFDMPLVIQLLVKCLATDGSFLKNIFGPDSTFNDASKTIIFVKVLRFLEKSNNVDQKTSLVNHLMHALDVEHTDMKALCVYDYHNMNGLSEKLEEAFMVDTVLNSPTNALFLAGTNILKVIESPNGSERNLIVALEHLERHILTSKPGLHHQEYEFEIMRYFTKYLKFAGLYGYAIHIINIYKEHMSEELRELHDFALFSFFLEMELCDCSIRLGLSEDSAVSLASSGTILKQLSSVVSKGNKLKLVTSEMVMSWKLHQLRHLLLVGDQRQSLEKSLAILKFLDSKSEFNLKETTSNSTYLERFSNLLIIAKFQFLSGKLNLQMGSFHEAIKNLKLAIKLLFSVIKKLGNNVPKGPFYDIKWTSADLLFTSYTVAVDTFKHLGLSGDVLFYVNELRKLNDSNRAILTSALNSYLLCNHLTLTGDLEDAHAELEKAQSLSSDHNIPVLRFSELFSQAFWTASNRCHIDVASVESGRVEMLKIVKKRQVSHSLKNMDTAQLTSSVKTHDFGESVLQLEHALTLCGTSFESHVNEYVLDHTHGAISKALLEVKKMIDDLKKKLESITVFSSLAESPQALPMISSIFQNQRLIENADFKERILSVSNILLQCKDILLKISSESNFSVLDVHEMHDTNKVTLQCVSLLSSVATLKDESTDALLDQLYNLQDVPRLLPFLNSGIIHNMRASDLSLTANELLPAPVLGHKDHICVLSSNVVESIREELPKKWSVISIDVCPYSGDLLLSKVNSTTYRSPFFLRLPLQRSSGRDDTISDCCLSFQQLRDSFKEVITQSNLSTKASTTSEIKTKEDRRKWWKLRFSLDLKLKQLLQCVERRWICGFQGLFNDSFQSDDLFHDFKQDFNNIWHRLLSFENRSPDDNGALHLSDLVVRLFYDFNVSDEISMQERNESGLDDLIYFVLDQLLYHGSGNVFEDFDIVFCRDLLYRLIQNYSSTRENLARAQKYEHHEEHLVLIPGTSCAFFPWESLSFLRGKSVTRMPSVYSLLEVLRTQKNTLLVSIGSHGGLFYMVNPSGDLMRTETRFLPLFESIGSQRKSGIVGKRPSEDFFLGELLKTDVFVYLGHGGCEQYVKSSTLIRAILSEKKGILPPSFLIGCSSGALQLNGALEPNGNIYNWLLCGSPMVVANLWDVTDKDIDLFSLSLLQKWGLLPGCERGPLNVSQAVAKSRGECTLKYLNGSAPIVYGLPLRLG